MKNKFGERLGELLIERNISQRKLSRIIGVSSPTISDWVKGKVQPTADNILLVAEFFDVSTDYILGKTE
jgi:transcriptional regulator, xre family